jgi:glycine/D-amino acid oxidase-like deaminating enzyme
MAAVDRISFAVLDANGRQVAQGVTDANAIELPPGDYTVVVRASTGELRADHVVVAARGDSVVTVAIEGTRFQLRR